MRNEEIFTLRFSFREINRSVTLVKQNFSKSTRRMSRTESTTSLAKNSDDGSRRNSKCDNCNGCNENKLEINAQTPLNSKTCSLGTISYYGSETAVVQSLNSTPFNRYVH